MLRELAKPNFLKHHCAQRLFSDLNIRILSEISVSPEAILVRIRAVFSWKSETFIFFCCCLFTCYSYALDFIVIFLSFNWLFLFSTIASSYLCSSANVFILKSENGSSCYKIFRNLFSSVLLTYGKPFEYFKIIHTKCYFTIFKSLGNVKILIF